MRDEKKPMKAKKELPSKKKSEKKIAEPSKPDPTKFGDWTVKGRCIDF